MKNLIKSIVIFLICLAVPIVAEILPDNFSFVVGLISGASIGILIWKGADIDE